MHRIARVIAIPALLAACACIGDPSRALELRRFSDTSIRAVLGDSRLDSDTTFVIRDEATWDAFWNTFIATSALGAAIKAETPKVDFDEQMLLVGGAGIGSGDREIDIVEARVFAESVVVTVRVQHRVRKKCRAGTLTAPVAIAHVDRVTQRVVFRNTWEDLSCGQNPFEALARLRRQNLTSSPGDRTFE